MIESNQNPMLEAEAAVAEETRREDKEFERAITKDFPAIDDLNHFLAGRELERVEAGSTPGWFLLHFSGTDEQGRKIFLNVYCGGAHTGHASPYGANDLQYWHTAALHFINDDKDGGGAYLAIRDRRNPQLAITAPGPAYCAECGEEFYFSTAETSCNECRGNRTSEEVGVKAAEESKLEVKVIHPRCSVCGELAPVTVLGTHYCVLHARD